VTPATVPGDHCSPELTGRLTDMSTTPPVYRHTLTARELRKRRILRRFLYSQLALRQGLLIALGRESPLVPFTVEADPPSVYWVFRLRDGIADSLPGRLGLPTGITPVAVRVLPDDERQFLLTLNVYRVSGITNGMRAEWSIYVDDPHTGVPRYLVLDARSSTRSMDPVDVFTPASTVRHERDGRQLTTTVGDRPGGFECRLTLPDAMSDLPSVSCAPEWVSANDNIYWSNGVCDRTFYDAGLAHPSMIRLGADDVSIDDGSRWADFIEPDPAHVLVYRQAIEFVVSPWDNIEQLAR